MPLHAESVRSSSTHSSARNTGRADRKPCALEVKLNDIDTLLLVIHHQGIEAVSAQL
jgi:hypothetical protein